MRSINVGAWILKVSSSFDLLLSFLPFEISYIGTLICTCYKTQLLGKYEKFKEDFKEEKFKEYFILEAMARTSTQETTLGHFFSSSSLMLSITS